MRIDLYGREIEAVRNEGRWEVFHVGAEGKRRLAWDIAIPEWIDEDSIVGYLDDLFHEHATPDHPQVRELRGGA